MASSIFGDDGVDDLLNRNVNQEDNELPSDGENNENPFGEHDANAVGNGEGDNEEPIKVEPKKRSVRNPRQRLTVETLRGPRGIHTIEDYFKDIKFQGKGNEKNDLDEIMRRLQHWAHRMYPNYKFDDVIANIERLGKKKPLQVHMSRYRLGMLESLKLTEDKEVMDDDDNEGVQDEPFDEFDALLGEQIAISKLAPKTPSTSRNMGNTSATSSTLTTPSFERGGAGGAVMSTPYSGIFNLNETDTSDLAQPLPPSQPTSPKKLSSEQMARIAENRRAALERLKAKKKQQEMDVI